MFKAVTISILAHALLFIPISKAPVSMMKKEGKEPVMVDYVRVKDVTSRAIEPPRVDIEKKAEMRPPKELKAEGDLKKQVKNDYINYYQLIREKVRREVKDRYAGCSKEGEVALNFVLNSNGTLASHSVDTGKSTDDAELVRMASASLVSAAPFRPFPKSLTAKTMSFSLAIEFRKK